MQTLHPVPQCQPAYAGGPEQCPKDWHSNDDGLVSATAGTLAGQIVRLAAGFDPATQTFSRTRCSFQANRYLEISWAHFSRGSAIRLLAQICSQLPSVAKFAWGDMAPRMADGENAQVMKDIRAAYDGRLTHPRPEYDWLIGGWNAICRDGGVQRVVTNLYWKQYVDKAITFMRNRGLKLKRTLGLLCRLYASGKQSIYTDCLKEWPGDEAQATQCAMAKYDRESATGYLQTSVWDGQVDTWPTAGQVNWGGGTVNTSKQLPPASSASPTTQASKSMWPWVAVGAGIVVVVGGGAWYLKNRKRGKRRRRR